MESRDTGLSANVYLNEMLIQLTVLLGYKVRNKKNALGHYWDGGGYTVTDQNQQCSRTAPSHLYHERKHAVMFDIFANCFSFIETVTEVLIYFPPFWNTG